MAHEYRFLDTAKDELAQALAYLSAMTGSSKAPLSLLSEIQRVIDVTCAFPTMHSVSRISQLAEKGYRVALAGSYALLYTFDEETVYIAHVFHKGKTTRIWCSRIR